MARWRRLAAPVVNVVVDQEHAVVVNDLRGSYSIAVA